MFSRRTFLKTAGATAAIGAVGSFNILKAHAAEDLNWSIHCDLTGPAAEGGKFQGAGFTEYANWVNSNGGIRGRKIALTVNDFDLQGRRCRRQSQEGARTGSG